MNDFNDSHSPGDAEESASPEWVLGRGEDLEIALQAAERLLHQAEERRRHEHNRTLAISSLMAGTLLSLFASLLLTFEFLTSNPLVVGVGIVGALAGLGVLVACASALQKQRRLMAYDHTLGLAAQLAGMVGETFVSVSERERWGYMRLQTTKLRLSAFPLVDYRSNRREAN